MARCEACGAELEEGVCGACLLAVGLETEVATMASAAGGDLAGPDAESFGPYRIVRRLGEGGMGTVYLAEQTEPIRRQVALKVIKAGMDSREVLARFTYERQALAMMDHPNIAHVLEAGETKRGLPYFVMEYIAGEPITRYCDQKRLSTRERLGLFLRVCQALQHAHQKGVIHRDIKPSNVLVMEVDGVAVPKVIDFGIARAMDLRGLERSVFTEMGQMIGTPEYMSPEAADVMTQDVDTASDVYSLGVLLYEVLIGAVPFEGRALRQAGLVELVRIIREEEAPPMTSKLTAMGEGATAIAERRRTDVTSLKRQVTGDLQWIVRKAVEKGKDRRYGTVAELAGDLERHLADEPVLAGPPGLGYRWGKFVKRNRLGVMAGAAVAAAVMAGMGMTLWQAGVARRERAMALEARDRAEEARVAAVGAERRADGSLRDVRTLANAMLFEMDEQVKGLAGATPVRQALVRMGLAYLDKAGTEGESSLGPAYFRMGELQGREVLMDQAGAQESYRRSVRILEKDGGSRLVLGLARLRLAEWAETERERAEELGKAAAILEELRRKEGKDARTEEALARVMVAQGRLEEAERMGGGRAEVMAELARGWMKRQEYGRALAAAEAGLRDVELGLQGKPRHMPYRLVEGVLGVKRAECLLRQDRVGEAEPAAAGALAGLDRLAKEDPENAAYQLQYATGEQVAGEVTMRVGNRKESDAHFGRAMEAVRRQRERYPKNDTVAEIAAGVATARAERDLRAQDWSAAVAAGEEASGILLAQTGGDGKGKRGLRRQWVEARLMVGRGLANQRELGRARAVYLEAYRESAGLQGAEATEEDRRLQVRAEGEMGAFAASMGRMAESAGHRRRAMEMAERVGDRGLEYANAEALIGIWLRQNRLEEARQLAGRYVAKLERAYREGGGVSEGVRLWRLLNWKGDLEGRAGNPEAGLTAGARALAVARELAARDPRAEGGRRRVVTAEQNLVAGMRAAGDREGALGAIRALGQRYMGGDWRRAPLAEWEYGATILLAVTGQLLAFLESEEALVYAERAKEMAGSLTAADGKNGRFRALFLRASNEVVSASVNSGATEGVLREEGVQMEERRRSLGLGAGAWLGMAGAEVRLASQYRRVGRPERGWEGWSAARKTLGEALRQAEGVVKRTPEDLGASDILRDGYALRGLVEELYGESGAGESYRLALGAAERLAAAEPGERQRREDVATARRQMERWKRRPGLLADVVRGKWGVRLEEEELTAENVRRWLGLVERMRGYLLLDMSPRLQVAQFTGTLARRVYEKSPTVENRRGLVDALYEVGFHVNWFRRYQVGVGREAAKADALAAMNESVALAEEMHRRGEWPRAETGRRMSIRVFRDSVAAGR